MIVQKPADEIRPGDMMLFLGDGHLVTEIDSYRHPSFPSAFAIARWADDASGITLSHGSWFEVLVAP